MKTIYTTIFIFLFCHLHAQTTEFLVGINSGFSFFRGPDATSQTAFFGYDRNDIILLEPYGSKFGLNIGGEITLQHINRKKLIAGLAVGYDRLVSVVAITGQGHIAPGDGISRLPASGKAKLIQNASNFYPFIGKRFSLNKCAIDINMGADMALLLSAQQKGYYRIPDGQKELFSTSYNHPTLDIRPRLQLKIQYQRTGVLLGYSLGLTEYYEPTIWWIRSESKAHSNVIRTGVFYKL